VLGVLNWKIRRGSQRAGAAAISSTGIEKPVRKPDSVTIFGSGTERLAGLERFLDASGAGWCAKSFALSSISVDWSACSEPTGM